MPAGPYPTIFFNEGPGFVYVREIGSGLYGNAVLVRCILDLKLYVRKEAKTLDRLDDKYFRKLDATKVIPVKDTDNVVNFAGGCVYTDLHQQRGYEVSYWEYYGSGTLGSAIKTFARTDITIPDQWLGKWLYDMLGVLSRIHRVGVAHCDTHDENWFLHRSRHNSSSVPDIGLGDWGLAQNRQNETPAQFAKDCVQDYHLIAKWFAGQVLDRTRASREFFELHGRLWEYIQRFYADKDIDGFKARVEILRSDAFQLYRNSPRPSKLQDELIKPSSDDRLFRVISAADLHEEKYRRLKRFQLVMLDSEARKVYTLDESATFGRYKMHTSGAWTQGKVLDRWSINQLPRKRPRR